MATTYSAADNGERSYRHDPRMRQALARIGQQDREMAAGGPAGTSLYWLLRSRRPKFAALAGRPCQADLLVIACALADCGSKLVVTSDQQGPVSASLGAAGLEWILRSGECLPCLRRVRPYDCLIIGETDTDPERWVGRLGEDALVLGVARNASTVRQLAEKILDGRLAGEVAQLRDGRRHLLIAHHAAG